MKKTYQTPSVECIELVVEEIALEGDQFQGDNSQGWE